jgi:hypothetical protein
MQGVGGKDAEWPEFWRVGAGAQEGLPPPVYPPSRPLLRDRFLKKRGSRAGQSVLLEGNFGLKFLATVKKLSGTLTWLFSKVIAIASSTSLRGSSGGMATIRYKDGHIATTV